MRKIIAACVLFGVVAGVVVALSPTGRAQTPPTRWHYAYLYHLDGYEPAIAYAELDDCRIEPLAFGPVSVPASRGLVTWRGARARAVAHALSTLGQNGWEMIGEGRAYCHYSDHRVLHFRRRE